MELCFECKKVNKGVICKGCNDKKVAELEAELALERKTVQVLAESIETGTGWEKQKVIEWATAKAKED